jgi:chromosome segregation ATPase
MNKYLIFGILIVLFSSCVAKKKFVAMEESRNRAERRVKELTNDVTGLQNQYNQAKTDFHKNDNLKTQYIDSLSKVIIGLNENLSEKSGDIEGQIGNFQLEKKRLTQLLIDKDKEFRTLNQKVVTLEGELSVLNEQLTSLKLELQNLQAASTIQSSKLKEAEEKVSGLNAQLDKKNAEIQNLRTEMKKKDAEIEKLNNNVKLLKSQVGQK